MNKRAQLILVTAFVVALGASYFVYRIVGNRLQAIADDAVDEVGGPQCNYKRGYENELRPLVHYGTYPADVIASSALCKKGCRNSLAKGMRLQSTAKSWVYTAFVHASVNGCIPRDRK